MTLPPIPAAASFPPAAPPRVSPPPPQLYRPLPELLPRPQPARPCAQLLPRRGPSPDRRALVRSERGCSERWSPSVPDRRGPHHRRPLRAPASSRRGQPSELGRIHMRDHELADVRLSCLPELLPYSAPPPPQTPDPPPPLNSGRRRPQLWPPPQRARRPTELPPRVRAELTGTAELCFAWTVMDR